MKRQKIALLGILVLFLAIIQLLPPAPAKKEVLSQKQSAYWFVLYRDQNKEYLYQGVPGEITQSKLVRVFNVKTGVPGERPTPLPQLVGKDYWLITAKNPTDDPETAPYFLILNIPAPTDPPYGPTPYDECNGQCNWTVPGAFGLHGINGNPEKLSRADPGSSGCIRHSDEDITYLYNLLQPEKEEIRYYIRS